VSPQSDRNHEQARAAAAFEIDLARMLSQVETSSTEQRDARQVADSLHNLRIAGLLAQYQHALTARLRWWHFFDRPFHAARFLRLRKALLRSRPRVRALEELDALLCRIEFGYQLSREARVRLRRAVSQGYLTPREGWRLTHSLGCQIGQYGDLVPKSVSTHRSVIGGTLTVLFGAAAAYCVAGFLVFVLDPCNRPTCSTVGYAVLAFLFGHLAPIAASTTWGSALASTVLRALNGAEDGSTNAAPPARSPLHGLTSLAW
jgi:hypothetical protein